MGRPCFLMVFLISALMILSTSHGFHRKVMEKVNYDSSTASPEEGGGNVRTMMEVMDYNDPGPNTNPRNGFVGSPPPQG